MGRLIDADLLKKNIAKWLQGSDPQETQMVSVDDIAVSVIMEIEEQPTADDAEKVVAELDNTKKTALDKVKTTILILNKSGLQELIDLCFEEAIKIVRKGGVEHE